MGKKRFCTLMCLLLMAFFCVGGATAFVYADVDGIDYTDPADFTYSETEDGLTITKYTGSSNQVSIPAEIDGKPVKAIGEWAFAVRGSLESVIVPEGVETIGDYAFRECGSLQSIILPDTIKSIGVEAFKRDYVLNNVKLPSSLESIGDYAFYYCDGLESIELPGSMKEIGSNVFNTCRKLTKVEFAEGIENIGSSAFENCSQLKSIELPDSVESMGDHVFFECYNLANVKMPKNLKEIPDCTFDLCYVLEQIQLPENLETVGEYAFNACRKLSVFDMPFNVKTIKKGAFSGCSSLKEVYFSPAVETVGDNAFEDCYVLNDVYIRDIDQFFKIRFGAGDSNPQKTSKATATTHVVYNLDDLAFKDLDFVYDGTEHTVVPECKKLSSEDFAFDELKITDAGRYTLVVKAANPKKCYGETTLKITVDKMHLDEDDVTISGMKDLTYTGKARIQSPIIKLGEQELTNESDYRIIYDNNVSVGNAKATVCFRGNYEGSKELTFKINPATASVKSITPGSRKMTVKMTTKPSSKGASSYQIWYKKKGTTTWKKTTTTASYKTIKYLKKGKYYYVKTRAYKKVGTTTYYGAWSKTKLSKKIK